jgi:hypothetical protein
MTRASILPSPRTGHCCTTTWAAGGGRVSGRVFSSGAQIANGSPAVAAGGCRGATSRLPLAGR